MATLNTLSIGISINTRDRGEDDRSFFGVSMSLHAGDGQRIPSQSRGALVLSYHLAASGDDGEGAPERFPGTPQPASGDDLPYRVELWNENKQAVDLVLAVTASGSIGYAAFYAAAREFPDRYVTLRHRNRIVSRWNGPTN